MAFSISKLTLPDCGTTNPNMPDGVGKNTCEPWTNEVIRKVASINQSFQEWKTELDKSVESLTWTGTQAAKDGYKAMTDIFNGGVRYFNAAKAAIKATTEAAASSIAGVDGSAFELQAITGEDLEEIAELIPDDVVIQQVADDDQGEYTLQNLADAVSTFVDALQKNINEIGSKLTEVATSKNDNSYIWQGKIVSTFKDAMSSNMSENLVNNFNSNLDDLNKLYDALNEAAKANSEGMSTSVNSVWSE